MEERLLQWWMYSAQGMYSDGQFRIGWNGLIDLNWSVELLTHREKGGRWRVTVGRGGSFGRVGGDLFGCFLCVSAVSYRDVWFVQSGVWARVDFQQESRASSPFASHVEKAWVPWVMAATAGTGSPRSQVPPAAPGGSQSHLASPACRWVRACLVWLVLPLPARVSVCQCVSDASAETKPNPCRTRALPCRAAIMWVPSASAESPSSSCPFP